MGYSFSSAQSPLPPPSRHGPSPGPSSPPPAAAPDPALVAQVLEGLPVPLVCLSHDDDPRLLAPNARFRDVFGYDAGALPSLGRWLELTYANPPYRQRMLDQWRQAAATARAGGVGRLQCRLLTAGGERPELLLEVSALGELLTVSLQDISPRRRSEAHRDDRRAERAETALAITEAIPVGTYTMVMEPDQPVAYFGFLSERFLAICGLDRERARANPLEAFACVHPDDHDAWLRLNAEAFAERRPFQGECRIVVDGEIRWVRAESVPRPLADGGTVWEGVLIDVTDHLPIPVIAMGLEGQPEGLVHNHRFTASFGYPSGTLPDLATWLERAYPHPACRREASDRWQAALALARGGDGLVPADDYRIHAADGSERDVRISATLLDDRIVMVVADITERKRTERALVRLRRREQEQEERQRVRLQDKLRTSLMAAAVAHEINQPLSAILLNCKLALANAGSDHEAVLQQLVLDAEQVVRTIEKMRSLLRNVQTEHQPVDLVTVVDSSLLGVRAQLRSQAVTVDPQGLVGPCWIQGDGDQLTVAISNLLRNALEALPPGRGGQLGLTLERADGRAQLTIDDNGCGIPADLIANLPLRSTKAEGTGIGLYVVQRTVENHNGSLAFAASPLGGTRVRLCFPLLPS